MINTMMTIDRATTNELPDVLRLLNDAAAWLRASGSDQWSRGFTADQIGPYVARAEVWLVRDDQGRAIATVRITPDADPDFYTVAEASELALYLSKLARDRALSPPGLGALILRWALDHAAQLGYPAVRLDAWRTNAGLQAYYARQGWRHVRTMEVTGRNSGALFEHPAVADLGARRALSAPVRRSDWLVPDTPVYVAGTGSGRVISVTHGGLMHPDALSLPALRYLIRLDDGTEVEAARRDVTARSAGDARCVS